LEAKSAKLARDTTPIGFGWREDGDHFAIDWMSGDPAPTAVARTTDLLMYKAMSTSSLQLPGKWFEVHGCVQAIRL